MESYKTTLNVPKHYKIDITGTNPITLNKTIEFENGVKIKLPIYLLDEEDSAKLAKRIKETLPPSNAIRTQNIIVIECVEIEEKTIYKNSEILLDEAYHLKIMRENALAKLTEQEKQLLNIK